MELPDYLPERIREVVEVDRLSRFLLTQNIDMGNLYVDYSHYNTIFKIQLFLNFKFIKLFIKN